MNFVNKDYLLVHLILLPMQTRPPATTAASPHYSTEHSILFMTTRLPGHLSQQRCIHTSPGNASVIQFH